MDGENPKGSPFLFFGIMILFSKKNSPKGPSIFDVLQQWMLKMRKGRYGADLGRSRIVTNYFDNR